MDDDDPVNGLPPVQDAFAPAPGSASHTAPIVAPRTSSSVLSVRRGTALAAALGLAVGVAMIAPATTAQAATGCATMSAPVYYQVNPKSGASLLTLSSSEAKGAASSFGFTTSGGTLFRAASGASSGLNAVHRLYRKGDFIWSSDATEISTAKQNGYTDQGVNFFAAKTGADICSVKVQRWAKSGKHQVSINSSGSNALSAAGWKAEGVAFYVASASTSTGSGSGSASYTTPPLTGTGASDSDGVFTIAVLPDTQQEVFGSDTRFADRNRWLVANRKRLDLRYETQVGDLVNWDTPSHDQYAHASNAMKVSEAAGLAWSPTIGNHDAAATCLGGGACPGTNVRTALRNTKTFNTFFPTSRFRAMKGTYESGKIDNSWSEFSAEGSTWMVMNLELWPRTGVLDWASKTIKAHPKSNVIIVTHAYLNGDGSISSTAAYGDNSPKTIYDKVIAPNSNVKLVLSGHVGIAGSRVDSRSGNPVVSYLQTFHDPKSNPTRLITINTKNGSVRGQVYYQRSNTYLSSADKTYTGLKWVK